MSTETNQTAPEAPQAPEGEGTTTEVETISIPKSEYEKLNQTLGSYKRQIKDLSKPREPETPQTKPEEFGLVHKSYLRAAQITAEDEVEFTLEKSKKWGMELDKLVDDEDFKEQLEKFRTKKSNALATSNVKGGAGTQQAKLTAEHWIAKGVPPTAADVPDRKTRATIARAMMKNARTSGKTFYND